MKTLVQQFPDQLEEAINISQAAQLHEDGPIRNVLVTGLGGSGIGGTTVSQLVAQEAKLPIIINKDYFLPDFVNEDTLVIVSSYSGNTEETLSAFEVARSKKARIACITSGGKVGEFAKELGLNVITIPGGNPPRSAFAYSFVQLFRLLEHYGVISSSYREDMQASLDQLRNKQEVISDRAMDLAKTLEGKLPIIYSDASFEGVGTRWRQQINENSKMLCWHHVFPEMNHNELVGWTQSNEQLAVVMLRNDNDYVRTQKRMDICKAIFAQYAASVTEVPSEGESNLEKAVYLIHLGDWLSVHLAELKDIDPVEVRVIDSLKQQLSEF